MTEEEKIKEQEEETLRSFIDTGMKAMSYCREQKINIGPEDLTKIVAMCFKDGYETRDRQTEELIDFYNQMALQKNTASMN